VKENKNRMYKLIRLLCLLIPIAKYRRKTRRHLQGILNAKIKQPKKDSIKSIEPEFGFDGLKKIMTLVDKKHSILDIASGDNVHTNYLKNQGFQNITTIDINNNASIKAFYEDHNFDNQFSCIWACMILEHALNPQNFLCKIKDDVKNGGYVAITVPPLKHEIVGGHVNLFNAGMLLYRMVLAGFDCSKAMVKSYGYNITVIVKVKKIKKLPKLYYDKGDIEFLSKYFPFDAEQNFNGQIDSLNW
jgi:hypothetical protein